MTTPLPLPGMPEPPAPSADYETWAKTVRPVYAAAASTGHTFLCWHIARDHHLPDPPNPKRDWARLMSELHRAGLIHQDGYGEARDHSAVHAWRGTRAAMQGRAA